MGRALLPFTFACALAGCGTSAHHAAAPTPTPVLGYTDPASKVNMRILSHIVRPTYALARVVMTNPTGKTYQASSPLSIVDSALKEPNNPGTIGVCSADSSHGSGLTYDSAPPHSRQTGWIRCDFPKATHVLAIFWLQHEIGAFHVS